MSAITGREPSHWHVLGDDNTPGRHRMTDPRTLAISPTHWPADERDYVAHLEEHERQAASPTPKDTDDPMVRAVLDWAASEQAILDKIRELAVSLRAELASGVPFSEAVSARGLAQVIPERLRERVSGLPARDDRARPQRGCI